MTIKEIRKLTNLSQADFAHKYDIPKRTIENWETENEKNKRECPPYVAKMLERLVKIDFNIADDETK
ncbi:MAG: helix-turn-helix domain-containing protein [Firmicutes bacterium]|nr:helix-turn-helix domain-containing protein [Bacillota bacterium]